MDFLVFILVCIISFPISVVNYLLTGRQEYFKYRGVLASMTINRYYSNFFNKHFKQQGCGHEFGGEETLSCALGKNQMMGTLSPKGEKMVRFLEKCEKYHCLKSVHDESFEEQKRELMSKK
jgi:hypothetical protein